MEQLVCDRVVDLREALRGWHEPVLQVGHDGAVYAVVRGRDESAREPTGAAKSRFTEPTELLILRAASDHVERCVVRGEQLVPSFVQPMSDGFLVASARCVRRRSGPEQNAIRVTADGRIATRLTLGDGIAHLRTDHDDQIWAAYFDEGVLGNYGWGSGLAQPIGRRGLVRFSGDGEVRWQFDHEVAGTEPVLDAYAFNLAGPDDAWLYFHTTFPVVRWHRGRYTVHTPRIRGATALATRGDRVLLAGSYGRRDVATVVPLDARRSPQTFALVNEDGDSLDQAVWHGIGVHLYGVIGAQVFRARDTW